VFLTLILTHIRKGLKIKYLREALYFLRFFCCQGNRLELLNGFECDGQGIGILGVLVVIGGDIGGVSAFRGTDDNVFIPSCRPDKIHRLV